MSDDKISRALYETLVSPNESDRNLEAANVVDGLFAIARAINSLARAVDGLQKINIEINTSKD